ncbi:MAG: VanZ family protein [Alphaproteobacteria bacterium]|nr:VanZ family protein [Alphaproteobacteria bacterium]
MSHGPLTEFLTRNGRTLRKLGRAGFAISILAIVVLSLLPGDDLPDVDLSDKIGHFIAYAEIALLGILGYRARTGTILAAVAALGGVLEIGQIYVPGRSADIVDFAVNGLGILAGYAAARLAGMAFSASRA